MLRPHQQFLSEEYLVYIVNELETPQSAEALIKLKAGQGLERRAQIKPVARAGAVTIDLTFKSYMPALVLSYLPLFTRTGSHSIRFPAKDVVEASRIMQFIGSYGPGLTP